MAAGHTPYATLHHTTPLYHDGGTKASPAAVWIHHAGVDCYLQSPATKMGLNNPDEESGKQQGCC
jgi:hypothetical protein